MNSRERFNRFTHGQSVDHIPDFEFWFWDTTLERWAGEGLPRELTPTACPDTEVLRDNLATYFDFEYIHGVPIKTRFIRTPAEEIIAEDEHTETVRTEIGEELVRFKPGHGESIPTHTKYPIKTREDWERVRDEFLPLDIDGRMPENWDALRKEYAERDYILNSPQMGFYGFLRNLLGVEEISMAIALEGEWVEEMMEHLLQLYLMVAERIVAEGVQLEITGWWEDMCYSSGPLISPQMFQDFMVPRYKKVTDFYRKHGMDRAILDSDGNVHKLAPLWLAGGINILMPCEAAHTDTLKLRQENSLELMLCGGIDKRQLAKGRAAIDAEMERVQRVMDLGGLLPHLDHLVPPDVSLADFMYYRDKKRKMIGK
ncbi:MAG: hypothetical protein JXL80_06400 [Planctomycetes bacterium]|nr:hypothetical protein [Planctomycetota bacterium]